MRQLDTLLVLRTTCEGHATVPGLIVGSLIVASAFISGNRTSSCSRTTGRFTVGRMISESKFSSTVEPHERPAGFTYCVEQKPQHSAASWGRRRTVLLQAAAAAAQQHLQHLQQQQQHVSCSSKQQQQPDHT